MFAPFGFDRQMEPRSAVLCTAEAALIVASPRRVSDLSCMSGPGRASPKGRVNSTKTCSLRGFFPQERCEGRVVSKLAKLAFNSKSKKYITMIIRLNLVHHPTSRPKD